MRKWLIVCILLVDCCRFLILTRGKNNTKNFVNFRRPLKIEKATISFVMSVSMEQIGSHWTDFHENWCLSNFSKICLENSSFIKIWQELLVLYTKINIHFWSHLVHFFFKFAEKTKTHTSSSVTLFLPRKSRRLWEEVEKYRRVEKATDDNKAHAYFTLDT
jgi:hypothetical protein